MRFLADENLEAPVVQGLRDVGHDVLEVGLRSPGLDDEAVISLSRRENRVLITNDKGFGELVFLQQKELPGILLLRLPGMSGRAKTPLVVAVVGTLGPRLRDHFVVVEPDRTRLRPFSSK